MRNLIIFAVSAIFLVQFSEMAHAQGSAWEKEYDKKRKAAHESLEAFAERICQVVGKSSDSESLEMLSEEIGEEVDDLNNARPASGLKKISRVRTQEYVGASRGSLKGLALDPPGCRTMVMEYWSKEMLLPDLILVQMKSDGAFIDNTNFGPIDGDMSTLYLRIDGRKVAGGYLSAPFQGNFKVVPGDHEYEFEADVMGPGMMLNMVEGKCGGVITIEKGAQLQPHVVFEMVGMDGYFTHCSLEDS